MHDPLTVAHEIRYPWRKYSRKTARNDFERNYRESFITIWHRDPERDGSDDSCGWFARARHGNADVLAKIKRRFEQDWDTVHTSDSQGQPYFSGFFEPITGRPVHSVIAITLNLFFIAALEAFGTREKAMKFMNKNLFELMFFAENPVDSLFATITQKFGSDGTREQRIEQMAAVVYGYILRQDRPWWRHPRWHIHHWEFRVQSWQQVRRWLLSRCCVCGGMFAYGESPCTNQWNSPPVRFLRGETGIFHSGCDLSVKSASVNQNTDPLS